MNTRATFFIQLTKEFGNIGFVSKQCTALVFLYNHPGFIYEVFYISDSSSHHDNTAGQFYPQTLKNQQE